VSDHEGQFVEGFGKSSARRNVDSEIVEASAEILDEGMAGDDDPGGTVSLQSSHGSKPGLQASVVGLDGVVGVGFGVVEGRGEQVIGDAGVRSIPVGGDLHW
jgi:hypothetical protein